MRKITGRSLGSSYATAVTEIPMSELDLREAVQPHLKDPRSQIQIGPEPHHAFIESMSPSVGQVNHSCLL